MTETDSKNDVASGQAPIVTRIVLVEDFEILRVGLRLLLNIETDLNVVGEADSHDTALAAVRETSPDLVLTNNELGGRSNLPLIEQLKGQDASTKVLVLSGHREEEYVREALENGADGYVLKDSSKLELMVGIRTVMRGQLYLSTQVVTNVLAGLPTDSNAVRKQSGTKITPREAEVMTLIASSFSSKEIAQKLGLSVKTAEKHRSNLMRKLGLRSSAAVTLYAIRHNYLRLDVDLPEKPGA